MFKKEKNHYEMVFELADGKIIREPISSKKRLTKEEALKKFYKIKKGVLYFRTEQIFPSVRYGDIKEISLEYRPSLAEELTAVQTDTNDSKTDPAIQKVQGKTDFDRSVFAEKRKSLDLTQKALEEQTGISRRKISDFERGKQLPTDEERWKLWEVLDDKSSPEIPPELFGSPDSSSEQTEKETNLKETDSETIKDHEVDSFEYDFEKQEINFSPDMFQKEKELKKKKKNLSKPPKGTKRTSTTTRIAVWGLIFVLGGSGMYALTQAAVALGTANGMQKSVSVIEEKLNNPEVKEDTTKQLETYMKGFVPTFANLPGTQTEQTERETLLKEYLGESLTFQKSSSYERTLIDYQIYEITEGSEYNIVSYLIEYELSEINSSTLSSSAKKEDATTEKESVTDKIYKQLLHVPYVEQEGMFAIVDYPYMTTAPAQKATTKPLSGEETLSEAASDTQAEVNEFLKQFYKSYAESSVEDIAYMMSEPESLNNSVEFVSSQEKIYDDNGSIIVKTTIVFQLKGTDVETIENMTLKLVKKDNKYFVEKLLHTHGGMENE
ncbi:conjugal transfer protein [Enterococcus sp. BWM-S5]|uniref:Conjugal transfer protein n=1 Tax=Enterococcus larvae TaxID=2794352 RepID=A0ABS4CN01_9ENTE|nr:conjugal transfer protein [Enterococcus larvae]MBP1047139.1 conjugal transfer protein [Enterococcus larvae]